MPGRARIVITKGKRADCKAELSIVDMNNGRVEKFGTSSSPMDSTIEKEVLAMREKLERAGHQADIIEQR
jgi:hypothetical protein